MTINAGVWIDHHKAVMVLIKEEGEEMLQILCDLDAPERSNSVAEDKRERKAANHLHKFYDEVIACMREANAILVMGPGEAKGEFAKRVEGSPLKGRIAETKTVDKLTDHQVAAIVREHFITTYNVQNS